MLNLLNREKHCLLYDLYLLKTFCSLICLFVLGKLPEEDYFNIFKRVIQYFSKSSFVLMMFSQGILRKRSITSIWIINQRFVKTPRIHWKFKTWWPVNVCQNKLIDFALAVQFIVLKWLFLYDFKVKRLRTLSGNYNRTESIVSDL